jgi:uncharacterized protein (TIGR02300 family)
VRGKSPGEIFIVADAKWGTKRTCLGCGKRFYDMRRAPIVCPDCDAPFKISAPPRARRQRASAEPAPPPPPSPPPAALAEAEDGAAATDDGAELAIVEAESSDKESEAEEKAAVTIEDPSELGEDDMAEVIEGIETPEKADV